MKRGKFSLSNTKLLSTDMGYLVPIHTMEVLPGDSIQQSTSALVRTQPVLAPVMHPVDVRIHHWFVPFRLIWDEWELFITGGPNGTSTPAVPVLPSPTFSVGSLGDYLGAPTGTPLVDISVLPFRAYALIFNEWYRDQDLVTPLGLATTSGPDYATNLTLQRCAWEKDYFTSARPFQQKGPAITLPLGTSAPVKGLGFQAGPTVAAAANVRETGGGTVSYARAVYTNDALQRMRTTNATGTEHPDVFADLTGASTITVSALRTAMALQRYSEARAKYGSRYVEYLRYLGVTSSDARLSRPEYLGGGKQIIQFSEVLQTAQGTDPVGQMRGHGIAAMRSNKYRRFFEEHGLVMTIMSIRPKTIYAQAQPKIWNRKTKEDYWQKELEHIGQQSVLNKEVYGAHTSPNGVFGYQDRYEEYRRSESSVSGEFRTTDLDFWHMARIFSSDPALNATFVQCVPTQRNFPVPSKDVVYVMAKHSIQARRLVAQNAKAFIY